MAGLTYVKGKLYGTTYEGGAGGDGTVFKVTPSSEHWLRTRRQVPDFNGLLFFSRPRAAGRDPSLVR
jgi:uncharacterized repeat protein (TIGR03803 family)